MNNVNITKQEKFLLMCLESDAVLSLGLVNSKRFNKTDMDSFEKWIENGFIQGGKLSQQSADIYKNTHWVVLSDEAWKMVEKLRRDSAEFNFNRRQWKKEGEVEK